MDPASTFFPQNKQKNKVMWSMSLVLRIGASGRSFLDFLRLLRFSGGSSSSQSIRKALGRESISMAFSPPTWDRHFYLGFLVGI